jgi:prepilin-type N-terminal cleavage/methylation domain-containing protein
MRHTEAGLTLIEMLVALSIVAVMAGSAVALLPRGNTAPNAQRALGSLMHDLNAAAGKTAALALPLELDWSAESYTLTTGSRVDLHTLPKGVQLRADLPPPYRVSAVGVPQDLAPLRLTLTDASRSESLQFDGLRATVLAGATHASE